MGGTGRGTNTLKLERKRTKKWDESDENDNAYSATISIHARQPGLARATQEERISGGFFRKHISCTLRSLLLFLFFICTLDLTCRRLVNYLVCQTNK